QAEDGIRDFHVTGVQTCALPICKRPPAFAPAGQSTQLIVGADGAPDTEIMARSAALYGGYGLRRVYYSAFSPIPDGSSLLPPTRSEGRRVGNAGSARCWRYRPM